MREHYVPQFYLRQFSNDGKSIRTFDKLTGAEYLSSIRRESSDEGFFDIAEAGEANVIERHLGRHETKYGVFLRTLLQRFDNNDRRPLTFEERRDLSYYVALQVVRTKEFREQSVDFLEAQYQAIANELIDKNFPETDRSKYPKVVFHGHDKIHATVLLSHEQLSEMALTLLKQTWVIYYSRDKQRQFLTSDNPVASSGPALVSPGGFAAYPLSPHYLLAIYERNGSTPTDGAFRFLKPDKIDAMNLLQIESAYRKVYSLNESFEHIRSKWDEIPRLRQTERQRAKAEMTGNLLLTKLIR